MVAKRWWRRPVVIVPTAIVAVTALTLALAAAVAVVGGMGGLALAVSASPVVGLWIGERRGR